jgi:hypothetical protein
MATNKALTPATELAMKSKVRFPNESEEYRGAREVLLVEEIELRRHIERVAAQRRQLPQGGRGQASARVDEAQGLFGQRRRLHPRPCQRRGCGRPRLQRLHAKGRCDSSFLERGDGQRNSRPRPGPARRARPGPTLDHFRHHA